MIEAEAAAGAAAADPDAAARAARRGRGGGGVSLLRGRVLCYGSGDLGERRDAVKRGQADAGPDVAIVGGGIAGTLLARQLRMRLPDLAHHGVRARRRRRRSRSASRPSRSRPTTSCAARSLAQYLYENHLPKNGIRYFFDGPKRDVPLTEMSELGTINLPFHAAFQLDRARLETDLIEMCRGEGIEVRIGARVTEIALGEGRERHELHVESPAGSERVRPRWVIDAAGPPGHARAPARAARARAASPDRLGLGPLRGTRRRRPDGRRGVPRPRAAHHARALDDPLPLPGLLGLADPAARRAHERRRGRHARARPRGAQSGGLPRVPRRARARCARSSPTRR